MSVAVFTPATLRSSPVFSLYPWMTDVILKSGSLETNVESWLKVNQISENDRALLCKVREIICVSLV